MADITWVIGILVSIAATVLVAAFKSLSGLLKDTKDKLDQTRRDHADFRVEVAQKYVSHDHMAKLEARMDKFEDRMVEAVDDIRKMINETIR